MGGGGGGGGALHGAAPGRVREGALAQLGGIAYPHHGQGLPPRSQFPVPIFSSDSFSWVSIARDRNGFRERQLHH